MALAHALARLVTNLRACTFMRPRTHLPTVPQTSETLARIRSLRHELHESCL